MFEINLVPDIKNNLLVKQRVANLVLFICIIVAAASAGLVLLLGSVVGGQNLAMANQDTEIACRSTGVLKSGSCGTQYGTPVLKVENINEFLTIQDQMNKLNTVNENKLLLSRVFGILDVILPTGAETVSISELNVDLENSTLSFEAQGDSTSNIDYKALEVFKKSAELSYYDHGRYMRRDAASGEFVEIPTMCITERTEKGVLYGVYHQGAKGCETPLIDLPAATDEDDEAAAEEPETPTVPKKDIKIRRIYASEEDRDNYMEENADNDGGFYFNSECATYREDGRFDEAATAAACPLLSGELAIRDSSNGRDSNDRLVLRFNANVLLTKDVFAFVNKHMRVVGPSRQNVTDSYTQIRNMFTEKAADCAPDDTQCQNAQTNAQSAEETE